MRIAILALLLSIPGCTYREQPPDIQKLVAPKVQAEEEPEGPYIPTESVEAEEEHIESFDSELVEADQAKQFYEAEVECLEAIEHIPIYKTGAMSVGTMRGVCGYRLRADRSRILTLGQLKERFNRE